MDVKLPIGIFADGGTDGPVIGTLIVVLDRAKNLPNRKSIGKQDPYCVVRLGKHAKRTEPDKRGGQTPRWDKELRFPVHDSGDYRMLKVVLFSEDKKTELIGETTISLDNILTASGGGQADGWHTCKCRDKYAGEIRVELTFWDERPREVAPLQVETRKEEVLREPPKEPKKIELLGGPRTAPGGTEGGSLVFASKPKRRPLPPDPTSQLMIEDGSKSKESHKSAPVAVPKSKEKERHRHRDNPERDRARDRERDRDRGYDQHDRPRHRTKDEKRREHRDKSRRRHDYDHEPHYEDEMDGERMHRYEEQRHEYGDYQHHHDEYQLTHTRRDRYQEEQDNLMYHEHNQPVHANVQGMPPHHMSGQAPLNHSQRQEYYDAPTHQLPPAEYHQQQPQNMLVLQGDAPPPLVPSRGNRQSLPPAATPTTMGLSSSFAAPTHNQVQSQMDYQDLNRNEYMGSNSSQDYRRVSERQSLEPSQVQRSQELVPYGSAQPTVPEHSFEHSILQPKQMAFNPQTQTFEIVSAPVNQQQQQQPPQQHQQSSQLPQLQPLQPPVPLQQAVQYHQQTPQPQHPQQIQQQPSQYHTSIAPATHVQAPQAMQLILRNTEEPSSPPPLPPQHHSLAAIANAPMNPPASSVALVSYLGGAPPPPPPPSHRGHQAGMGLPAATPAQQQQQQQALQSTPQQLPVQQQQTLPPQYQQPSQAQIYQQPPVQQAPVQQQELSLYQNVPQNTAAVQHELMAPQSASTTLNQLPPSLQVGVNSYREYQPPVYQAVAPQTAAPVQSQQPMQALVLAGQGFDAPQVPQHGLGANEPPAYSALELANGVANSGYQNQSQSQNRTPSYTVDSSASAQGTYQTPTHTTQNQQAALVRYGSGYEQSDTASSYSNPAISNQPVAVAHQSQYTAEPDELPMLSSNTINNGALALYNAAAPPPLPRHANASQRAIQQQPVQQQPQELPHNTSQRQPSWNANDGNNDSMRRSSPIPPQKQAYTSNYHKPYVRDVTGRPSLGSRRSISPIPPPAPSESSSTLYYDQANQQRVRPGPDSYQSISSQQRHPSAQDRRDSQYGYEQPRQPSFTPSHYSSGGDSTISANHSNYSNNDRGYESAITSASNSWTPKPMVQPGSHFRHNSDSSLPSYDTSMAHDHSGRRTPPNRQRSKDPRNVSFELESESAPIIKPRATSPNPGGRGPSPAPGGRGPSPAPYSNVAPTHPPPQKRNVLPERRMTVGIPFSPDSYDAINPVATFSTSPISKSPAGNVNTLPAARSPGAIASSPNHYMTPKEEKAARKKEEKAARKAAKKRVSTPGSQNRALHDDDILPEDTHAPEPEEHRRNSFVEYDDDDDEPSPVSPLIIPSKGPRELHTRMSRPAESANKLQKVRPAKSMGNIAAASSSSREKSARSARPLPGPPNAIMAPGNHYDYDYDSYNQHSSSGDHRRVSPQKPPKIPLDRGDMNRDEWALSKELSGISIGSSSRRRTVGFR